MVQVLCDLLSHHSLLAVQLVPACFAESSTFTPMRTVTVRRKRESGKCFLSAGLWHS